MSSFSSAFAALLVLSFSSSVLAQDCASCQPEFQFNPMAASFQAHQVLARQQGCVLASITSAQEQTAALQVMKDFIGYPYHATRNFQSAFLFLGGIRVDELSDPQAGNYTFEWLDGSGSFQVDRNTDTTTLDGTSSTQFTDFWSGDPNGGTGIFGAERYLALSLDENDSTGIPRGKWVDFSNTPSPALYKCCQETCGGAAFEYQFSPHATSWLDHGVLAASSHCQLAAITTPQEQDAAVQAMEAFVGFPYEDTENFASAFCYTGGRVVSEDSNPYYGNYTFEWTSTGATFEVNRNDNTEIPYTNFKGGDPNGGTPGFLFEPYLALSLDENGSSGIPRGDWIDFKCADSPALYQCCEGVSTSSLPINAFAQCQVGDEGTQPTRAPSVVSTPAPITRAPTTAPISTGTSPPSPTTTYDQDGVECFSEFVDLSNDPEAIRLDIATLNPFDTIDLPTMTPFLFKGTQPVSRLVVTKNGSINLDNSTLVGEGRIPITPGFLLGGANDPYEEVARIQVAQATYGISSTETSGVFYRLTTPNTILISWEPALIAGGRVQVRFQVELELDSGMIIMRWQGVGSFGDMLAVNVGIEDGAGLAVPATGSPFQDYGFAQYPSVFSPGDACRTFFVVPTTSMTPAPTPAPVVVPTPAPMETGGGGSVIYNQDITTCSSVFVPLDQDDMAIKLAITTQSFDPITSDAIDLRTPFLFKGTQPISRLIVTKNGSINLDNSTLVSDGLVPIAIGSINDDPYEDVARIQVAQATYGISNFMTSGVYWKDLPDSNSILISWEPALIAGGRIQARFQAQLDLETGNVEMRWKSPGSIGETLIVSVGIEDGAKLVVPAVGDNFEENGITAYPSIFSEDSCRTFFVV